MGDAAAEITQQAASRPRLARHVDILRAEMGCVKPVELRVSADLATPATIGWHRVLILLPADWRSWNDAERRAVLAHELAHVCRGDFLTGLLAQLSLASSSITPWRTGCRPGCGWSRSWPPTPGAPAYPAARFLISRLWPSWPCAAMTGRCAGRRGRFSLLVAPLFGGSRCFATPSMFVMSCSRAARDFSPSACSRHARLLVAGLRGPITPLLAQARAEAGPEAQVSAKGAFDLLYLPAETQDARRVQPAHAGPARDGAGRERLKDDSGPLDQAGSACRRGNRPASGLLGRISPELRRPPGPLSSHHLRASSSAR